MHVKSSAAPSSAVHGGASSTPAPAKGAKNGATDFNKMLSDAKAGQPASAATAPMTLPAAGKTAPTATTAAAAATAATAPATLSLDTASLAARS